MVFIKTPSKCLPLLHPPPPPPPPQKEKSAKQEEVLRGGIDCICLPLSNIWKPCYGAIKIWSRNLRTVPELYLRFH